MFELHEPPLAIVRLILKYFLASRVDSTLTWRHASAYGGRDRRTDLERRPRNTHQTKRRSSLTKEFRFTDSPRLLRACTWKKCLVQRNSYYMHDIRAMKRQHKLLRLTDRKKVLLSGDVYSGLPPDDDADKSIWLGNFQRMRWLGYSFVFISTSWKGRMATLPYFIKWRMIRGKIWNKLFLSLKRPKIKQYNCNLIRMHH